jgi:Ca2+-binding EF-hand superfamily protein
MAMKE